MNNDQSNYILRELAEYCSKIRRYPCKIQGKIEKKLYSRFGVEVRIDLTQIWFVAFELSAADVSWSSSVKK